MSTPSPRTAAPAFGKRRPDSSGAHRTPPTAPPSKRSQAEPPPGRVSRLSEAPRLSDAPPPPATVSSPPANQPSLTWSFIKANAVGFATAVCISAAFETGAIGAHAGIVSRLAVLVPSFVVAVSMGAMFKRPAAYLGQTLLEAGVRRGWADVIVGGSCGSLWMAIDVLLLHKVPSALSVGFAIGGVVAGYSFWRSQGFPGGAPRWLALIDFGYRSLRRI